MTISKNKPILVTGASGHLGYTICKVLKEQNYKVRVLIRSDSCLSYLSEFVDEVSYGDVTDFDSLVKATSGVERVIHSAGLITIGHEKKKEVYKVNVDGTKNVVEACLLNSVTRLVYVSSAYAVGYKTNSEIIVEKEFYDEKLVHSNYAKSKALSSSYVLGIDQSKLQTVVCMPTGIIGPGAYKGSHLGNFLRLIYKRKMPCSLKGSYNFVDVRDTADAVVNAMLIDKSGESYLIGGENMTVSEILNFLGEKGHVKVPTFECPLFLVRAVAPFVEFGSWIAHKDPLFTGNAVSVLNSNDNFDCSRAKNELGLKIRPVEESLFEQYCFVNNIEQN